MKRLYTIVTTLLITCCMLFAKLPSKECKDVSTDLPDGHEIMQVITLTIGIPYSVITKTERSHIYVGVQNLSDKPVKLRDIKLFPYYQLMWQARSKSDTPNIGKARFLPQWTPLQMPGIHNSLDQEFVEE